MAKKELIVGMIGVGDIAHQHHLRNWKELEAEGRVKLVGVCDIKKDRMQRAMDEYGAEKGYTSAKRMLSNGQYDIIDICTQNRMHAPMTLLALQAGSHVLVEKPMAMNAKEGAAMIRAAKKAGRTLMVAQNMRFDASSEAIKECAQKGELGDIYHINATMLRRRGIPGWGQFHIKKESMGGPLIDIGVHLMDLAVWIAGCPKPTAVSGKVYRMFGDRKDLCNRDWGQPYPPKEFDVEDHTSAFVRFKNDLTMSVEVSWAANIPEDVYDIQILGDKAGATVNPPGLYGYGKDKLTSTRFDWLPEQEGHRMEIRHFTECIEKDRPVRVQPEESLSIQKIIDAIYESSKRNREIRL